MKAVIAFIAGLIALPLVFALVAITGHMPSDSTSDPPQWEASLGMRALDASLEKRSDGLNNPIAANDQAAALAGQAIYAHDCAGCHGSSKGPSQWGARGFYPRPPQFFQEGTDVSAPEAYAAIRDGIRYSGMGAWRGQMKDDEMWKVANFVAKIEAPGGNKMNMGKD